jgi:NADPH:quinone reductase-like Zn-dependent oxidoreductase
MPRDPQRVDRLSYTHMHLADNIDIPHRKLGTMLCRVYAVAVSLYDVKIVDYSNTPGLVGRCNFAGVVVEVGEGLRRFKVGDRVLAVTFGLNAADKTAGAFAEYALGIEHLVCYIPEILLLTEMKIAHVEIPISNKLFLRGQNSVKSSSSVRLACVSTKR